MQSEKVYHKDVFIPPPLTEIDVTLKLNYTNHALRQADRDRFGWIKLPTYLNTSEATLIEVEVNNRDEVTSVVYRIDHCEKFDLVLVIATDGAKVKTVWLNRKTDRHPGLNKEKYARGF